MTDTSITAALMRDIARAGGSLPRPPESQDRLMMRLCWAIEAAGGDCAQVGRDDLIVALREEGLAIVEVEK